MPPPLPRFPSGPNNLPPYHQQYSAHAQGHGAAHGPPLGTNPSYLNASSQINPFSANNNVLGVAAGLNAAGFGVGVGMGVGDATGLGSHAARMGFQAAGLHQQQQQQGQPQHNFAADHGGPNIRSGHNKGRIREVWKHNLHEEMAVLRDLVDKYPYIAMDTEFPGIVSRPMGGFRGKSDYHYQCLRTNVDMLKVIQIGLALFNEDGETPPARPNSGDAAHVGMAGRRMAQQGPFPCAWQFNFKFSLKDDMYNEKSIESLQTAGIDFNLLERDGIDPHEFASLLIPSGLVCFENVRWISFHGGYDFGYLTKLLFCQPLPSDEVDFDRIMKLYFPSTYDVKHLMKHAIKLHNSGMLTPSDSTTAEILQKFEHKSGLESIAETLKVKRVGAAHQAGSDSLITGKVFFQMRERIFNGEIAEDHLGRVWGLGIPDGGLLMGHMLSNNNNNNNQQQQQQQQQQGATGGNNTAGGNPQEQTPGQGTSATTSNSNTGNASGQQNGVPSTPNTASVGLASTPAAQSHSTNGFNTGPVTPGGGGGVFGNFAFSGGSR